VNSKKLFFLFPLLLSSFFSKSQNGSHIDQMASCVDYAQGGEIELIRTIGKETKEIIEDIDIVIDVNAESVVDVLSADVYKWSESIIDFSDQQTRSLTDVIDQSTQEVLDALEALNIDQVERTIIRHNLSKSGQFVTAFITSPGYYAVRDDTLLEVLISTDNVTIDLNDFTVSGTAPLITIEPGHKNIEIKNGKLRSFEGLTGITVGHSCELITIENVTIFADLPFNAIAPGMVIDGQGGFVKDCVFRNCVICGFEDGLKASFVRKCIFESCSVLNCTRLGFNLLAPDSCLFNRCNVIGLLSNTRPVGIASTSARDCVFSECVVSYIQNSNLFLGAIGFWEATGLHNKIVNCIVNNVSAAVPADGILVTASNSVLEENEVFNISGNGINVDDANNFLIKNIAYNNTLSNFAGPIGNVYVYDHDGGIVDPVTGTLRDPFNLDNISVVGS